MAKKAILGYFSEKQISRDYKHRSIMLNVELDDEAYFQFSAFHNGKMAAKGRGRKKSSAALKDEIKIYVDELVAIARTPAPPAILSIQSKLSSFTDDFFPKNISDFLLSCKDEYSYLIIDDEDIGLNIPYGILFFPDRNVKNCISNRGFFLSEYYTIVRSISTNSTSLKITNVATISSDDLPGSTREESNLEALFNAIHPGAVISITDRNHLAAVLVNNDPNCFHFCCHGTRDCKIRLKKHGISEEIEMNFFNMHRFPQNTFVFLNICSSAYTHYDESIPRSIANKLIDRNTHLVVMTEWPIDDDFAYIIGTQFYARMFSDETALQAIHNIKKGTRNLSDKFTAMTYSLRGNPNLKISLHA